MKKILLTIVSTGLLFGTSLLAQAADTNSMSLEEAFIDAVANCGPSGSVAGAMGKTEDLDVQIALRNAEIIEAADAAAGAPGSAKPLQECMQKFLAGRGYGKTQMAVLPECTKEDMPRPFVNLGECVQDRGKLVIIQGYVPSKSAF